MMERKLNKMLREKAWEALLSITRENGDNNIKTQILYRQYWRLRRLLNR